MMVSYTKKYKLKEKVKVTALIKCRCLPFATLLLEVLFVCNLRSRKSLSVYKNNGV